jgi:CRP/FNR family cyclic AMP-dependent transcriptional regulator
MEVTPAELRAVPLFENISDDKLTTLMGVFERRQLPEGEVLFEAGDQATDFLLIVAGEVALRENGETRFRLRPLAPIGELGAITGLRRNTTAVTTQPSEIWCVSTRVLMEFFESRGQVAIPFYQNLLRIVADKVRRDERRIEEMRSNIVRTQKAMKRLRDLVLETQDTVLSKPVYETLQDLIEQNRRWHYLVEPAHTLRASVRFDDGREVPVLALSNTWLRLPLPTGAPPPWGLAWSGVLVLPTGEIPLSGTVDSADAEGVLIHLDLLIEEYEAKLEDYLTRLQMLDFVV